MRAGIAHNHAEKRLLPGKGKQALFVCGGKCAGWQVCKAGSSFSQRHARRTEKKLRNGEAAEFYDFKYRAKIGYLATIPPIFSI